MATETKETTGEVEVLRKATAAIAEGEVVKLDDVLKIIAPPPELPKIPEKIPLPALITEEQSKALERLAEVFGSVQPTTRRTLSKVECERLRDERETLDQIEQMVATRKESIRRAVMNHLDLEFEAMPEDERPKGAFRNADGHWVVPGRAHAGEGLEWSREVRSGAAKLDADMLQKLAESDEFPEFTRKDFLAMTTQVRVVDPNKVMLTIRKKPSILNAIRAATKSSVATASLFLRKAKA